MGDYSAHCIAVRIEFNRFFLRLLCSMPARRNVVCNVCWVVVDFGKSDGGVVLEVARKVSFTFECRRCRDHDELKEEVVALRQRVRELEGEKSAD